MPLLLIFIIIPLIEIVLFIVIGDEIGILATLGLTFLTAIIGASLIRIQGLGTLMSARRQMEGGEMPVKEIFDGICLAIAGAMLLTPGFFTDTIGFALLIPQIRDKIRKNSSKFIKTGFSMHDTNYGYEKRREHSDDIIDVEFERVDSEPEKIEENDGKKDT